MRKAKQSSNIRSGNGHAAAPLLHTFSLSPRTANYVPATLSAVLLILAFPVFPRFQLWPLAWVALTPLLCWLFQCGPKRGLQQAVFFGYPFMLGVLAWVHWMGVLPWLLLSATQAGYVAAFTLSVAFLAPLWTTGMGATLERPRPWLRHCLALLLPAAAWVFMEWLRSLGRLSIPWGFISTTQVHCQPLVSTARWWGAYGVSFLVVMVNCAVANWMLSRGRDRVRAGWLAVIAAASVPVLCGLSVLSLAVPSGRPLTVSLIQGNVPKAPTDSPSWAEYQRSVLDTYTRLSLEAARQRPDLIVWPETVIPGSFLQEPWLQAPVREVAQTTGAYLLFGSPDEHLYDNPPWRRNASFVMSPQGAVLGRYDKEHIVPYGEYVPGRSWLPFKELYGVPEVDVTRGVGHAPITTPLGSLGVMICYESMYPQIARQTVQQGADILLVITNDEWFGTSSAPYDHAADAAFRAAETGRWVAQAGSTGVSLFADPTGRSHKATSMFTVAVDTMKVATQQGTTLYTQLGDWPPLLAIPLLLTALVFRVRQRVLERIRKSA